MKVVPFVKSTLIWTSVVAVAMFGVGLYSTLSHGRHWGASDALVAIAIYWCIALVAVLVFKIRSAIRLAIADMPLTRSSATPADTPTPARPAPGGPRGPSRS